MAAKIKVIELAKELGVTSKDLMVAAEEMGHKGVRAMTPLDQALANTITRLFATLEQARGALLSHFCANCIRRVRLRLISRLRRSR